MMCSRSSSSLVAAAALASALLLFCCLTTGDAAANGGLRLGYYSSTCPRAEDIVREQVAQLYHKHGNTAVSWLRALFHDCMVGSCDASLLLDTSPAAGVSEKSAPRSFGMRNFKYVDAIKAALERECPGVVSCADVLALAARDGAAALGGPRAAAVPVRTGRLDARRASPHADVARDIPNHNDTVSAVLARFAAAGVDAEGAVALLGAHSVGRVHCFNLVGRLYPAVDAGLDPGYGEYLRGRCPTADARERTRATWRTRATTAPRPWRSTTCTTRTCWRGGGSCSSTSGSPTTRAPRPSSPSSPPTTATSTSGSPPR